MAKNYGPNRLKELRQYVGISQEELAERVGAHKTTISKLEKGEIELTVAWAQKLAAALGHQIQWWEMPGAGLVLRPDEREMLEGYRALNDQAKRMIRSMVDAGREPPEPPDEAPPEEAAPADAQPRRTRTTRAGRAKYKAA